MSSFTTEIIDVHASSRARGQVRPVLPDDLDRIRDLALGAGANEQAGPLSRRLFESPWRDSALSSLVYEDANGRLLGCVAMTARPMIFRDRPIRAVVGHDFIIDASRGGTRAGIELARRVLDGPQDLSLALWSDFGRRIWTSLGGSVTPFHSLAWTRALMPAKYVLRMLKRGGLPESAAVALYPACHAVDATLNVLRRRPVLAGRPNAVCDDLDAVTMMSYVTAFASDRALRPSYDAASLSALLSALDAGAAHRGRLYKIAVRTPSGRPLGWYVYFLRAGGAAEVLQIGGKDEALREVVDHLFEHARRRGAVSVTGPMDARLVGALSEKHCAFQRPRNTWALFHARDGRIAEAIHAGDAFLSRLEGAPWTEIEA